MLKTIQQRNRMVKIVLGVLLGVICIAMVITMVPGPVGQMGTNPDTVASVGGRDITAMEVRQQLERVTRGQGVPPVLRGLYARQLVEQMIFERAVELEAERLGLTVTPGEESDRIKQLLPDLFVGGTWVGKDRYAAEVQARTGMGVEEFEESLRKSLVQEKLRQLVTDGITVSAAEGQSEFRRQNEKVQIEYVLLKPEDLAGAIHPTDAELSAYFAKNQSRYQLPERRSARYALLDLNQLRERAKISDEEIRAYYNQHLKDYKVPNRVHVEHILFKTVGKTDAEVAEIRKKAEEILNKAKHGGNFEDLAKQNSEDITKDKGGDLGWIVEGQTVPAFEHAAFSLPKGSISDLVQTEYGFHIIKVLDRETAHTKSLDEVRLSILSTLSDEKVQQLSRDISAQMAAAVRQSNRQSIDAIAKKFDLQAGETPAVSASEPVGELGDSPDLHAAFFQLHPGELSAPIRLDRGYAIITVKDIVPAHRATFVEVRDRVLADYRREKSSELAQSRAEELARRAKAGEALPQVAKALGLEVKKSDLFSRTGTVKDVGSASQLQTAFTMPIGQISAPTPLGGNWLVFRVSNRQEPNPDDFAKQSTQIEQTLLQTKREAAFDAFRKALEDRLRQDGKLAINAEAMKRLTSTPSL
jgi:peptidyl-prolyl cis-trans isomerase D